MRLSAALGYAETAWLRGSRMTGMPRKRIWCRPRWNLELEVLELSAELVDEA
jgi:hypothetical protein